MPDGPSAGRSTLRALGSAKGALEPGSPVRRRAVVAPPWRRCTLVAVGAPAQARCTLVAEGAEEVVLLGRERLR